MIIQSVLFYLFSIILRLSAFLVVTSKNPVHSVLFLILAFFNSAGIFILLGAEFIAMLMVIVYVGAVAVLFLFVVMMMDINITKVKDTGLKYFPLGLAVIIVLFIELTILIQSWDQITALSKQTNNEATKIVEDVTNTELLGKVLYTHFALLFQMAGMILLVAMIGAIVLTLRSRPGVRRQKISEQLNRKVADCIEVVNVKSGKGV